MYYKYEYGQKYLVMFFSVAVLETSLERIEHNTATVDVKSVINLFILTIQPLSGFTSLYLFLNSVLFYCTQNLNNLTNDLNIDN